MKRDLSGFRTLLALLALAVLAGNYYQIQAGTSIIPGKVDTFLQGYDRAFARAVVIIERINADDPTSAPVEIADTATPKPTREVVKSPTPTFVPSPTAVSTPTPEPTAPPTVPPTVPPTFTPIAAATALPPTAAPSPTAEPSPVPQKIEAYWFKPFDLTEYSVAASAEDAGMMIVQKINYNYAGTISNTFDLAIDAKPSWIQPMDVRWPQLTDNILLAFVYRLSGDRECRSAPLFVMSKRGEEWYVWYAYFGKKYSIRTQCPPAT